MSRFKTANPRILMLSQRNHSIHVSRCWMYEFEDIVRAVDTVELVTPPAGLFYKLAKRAQKTAGMGKLLYPGLSKSTVNKDYDLFIACFHSPLDIISLNSIEGWRKKCHKSVCMLNEIWAKDIEAWQHFLKLLKNFDYIFLNSSSSISAVSNIVQRSCHYLPYGVDTIRFCPYPLPPQRSIDVYSIGHRSLITHDALLASTELNQFFYIYDTISGLYVSNHQQHRQLFSNLIKRSRYFITNNANFDRLDKTDGQQELSPRFFEGAAAGAVLIGMPPACEDYEQNFGWSDAVIQIPYDAPNIADIITNLDAQPDRLARASRNNVVNSLLRHDWLYRWRQILATVGLEPTPEVVVREAQLKNLAKLISAQESKVS